VIKRRRRSKKAVVRKLAAFSGWSGKDPAIHDGPE